MWQNLFRNPPCCLSAQKLAAKPCLQVELRRQKNPDQNEFVELARSAQIDVVHVEGVKRDAPHPQWINRKREIDELKELLQWSGASLLLVNHDLSPGQQRNLKRSLRLPDDHPNKSLFSLFLLNEPAVTVIAG